MHPTLARQLKRLVDAPPGDHPPAEIEQLRRFLEEHAAPEPLLRLAGRLPDFIHRVDNTYAQFERDLDLRTRSLQLSSNELFGINEELRQALESRDKAIQKLQDLARRLQNSLPDDFPQDGDKPESLTRLVALLASLIDRQEAYQAEMLALHTDLANQKFALDQHAIVSITDLQGNITYANDRFCEISGFTREELIASNHSIVRSDYHPPEFFTSLWRTISSGEVWHGEIRNCSKRGDIYWVSATIVPLTDADGRPSQYIAIRTDITERKKIEAALAEQLHFIEVLIEALPTALYLKDAQGRYQRFNRAFEHLFGVDRKDWIGRNVFDLVPGEMAGLMHAKDEELLRQGGIQTYEARFINHRSGESHDGLYWKARLTRPDGGVTGLVGAVLDITERKRSEQELENAKLAAEAANKSKSNFLANMSHEIRTPMNGIIGMTELALDTELDPTQRDYLNIVRGSAEALLVILNDILDFSKIEAGKLTIERVPFNLPVVIAEALKSIAARAEKKGLRLVCDLPADLPTQVTGDPGRIRQILTNLCDNAIKFTEAGEITVRTRAERIDDEHALVHVSVSDTGIGIPREKQQQIFEAFTQADASTTRRFGGTGLGLTICSRLVSLMVGEMWVESDPGQGSTFHFTAQVRCPGLGSKDGDHPPPLTTWPGVPALVVDDHPVNRRCLVHWLRAWGFTVDEALNGLEALEKCRAAPPGQSPPYQVVLLDANMPLLDGFGFAEAMHDEGRVNDVQIVMLSSGGARGDAQRCRTLGLGGYLTKPATPTELRETLTRILAPRGASGEAGGASRFITRNSLKEHQRRLSILLAEDNVINQRLVIQILEKWGHAVTLARDGQEAVDIFPSARWDIVFMDMQMPIMGGIEATRRIRALEAPGQHTPIVAMTANAMAEDRQRCLEAGMDDHLAKPINVPAVHRLLDHYCARAGIAPASRTIDRPAIDAALAAVDPEVMSAVGEVVTIQLPQDVAVALDAHRGHDWEALRRAAHNLKSTFGLFGLEALADTARQIEADPSSTLPALLADLQAASGLIVASLAGQGEGG